MLIAILLAAEWIAGTRTAPIEPSELRCGSRNDIVERRFVAHTAVVSRAVWRVAAPGMRDLFVNGHRVSSTALPPFTPYRKRILEEEFDVTPNVRSGQENVLRVELGNGWYNPLPLSLWYAYDLREFLAVGVPCVRATLSVAYADGRTDEIATDGTWCLAKGRILQDSLYLGVVEDLRLDTAVVGSARVVEGPSGKVVPAGGFPKTVVYARERAKQVTQLAKDVWLVDMGANCAGTIRARLRGVPKGATVRFRQGERQWPDGTVNVLSSVAGQIKRTDKGPLYAVAEQCDAVIGDGSPEITFEPRFTFHVFRYVQVEGLTVPPAVEDFERLAWSADVKDRSSFMCSNERLNRLHEVCRRTFRSNLQSVQSDCPGREKFGYGGDMACTVDAFWSNYDMTEFYRKVLRDFLDEAEDDGLFTETAPFVGIASNSAYPVSKQSPDSLVAGKGTRAAPIGWAVGVPVIVDSLVRYAGDIESVRMAYPALLRYIGRIRDRYPENDIPECLGDWLALDGEKADAELTGLAHWHQFVALTAKFARLLGKDDDARRLDALSRVIAAKFRASYLHDGGVVGSGRQGEQLFALYHGLVDGADADRAYDVLTADIRRRGFSHTTGMFATKYLFEVLPLRGDAEMAARVAMHEGFPGWFHMLERGATTLWENWSEAKILAVHSNCHPMFGSVDEWMIRHVLGISVCADAVGCDKVRIDPKPLPGVMSASGWFDTPRGRISVSWRRGEDGRLDVEKVVPAGVSVVRGVQ